MANTHIADYCVEIYDEEAKAIPDMERIAKLREASQAVALNIHSLDMTDDEAVSRFVAKYGRVPSPWIAEDATELTFS